MGGINHQKMAGLWHCWLYPHELLIPFIRFWSMSGPQMDVPNGEATWCDVLVQSRLKKSRTESSRTNRTSLWYWLTWRTGKICHCLNGKTSKLFPVGHFQSQTLTNYQRVRLKSWWFLAAVPWISEALTIFYWYHGIRKGTLWWWLT